MLAPAVVDAHLQRAVALSGGKPEEMRCVVRADRETAYRDVEVVLRGCGKARISHVVFGAIPGSEGGE